MAASQRHLIPPSEMPRTPHRSASGAPIRPAIIRAMLRTQEAFQKAGEKLDELFDEVTKASQSGMPPPPAPNGRGEKQ